MVRTKILTQMQAIEHQEFVTFEKEAGLKDYSRFESQGVWVYMRAFNSGRLSLLKQALTISMQDDQLTESILGNTLEEHLLALEQSDEAEEVVQEMLLGKQELIAENSGFGQWVEPLTQTDQEKGDV